MTFGCTRSRSSSLSHGAIEAPRFAPLVTLRIELRDAAAITGGTFEGARLRGTVMPGGSRWTRSRSDGVVELELRASLQTHDGEGIELAMIGADDRTVARFETAAPAYMFLNRVLAVGTVARELHTLDELR